MKRLLNNILKIKNGLKLLLLLSLICSVSQAQNKFEREHRIKKSQFPKAAKDIVLKESGIKQLRFYREINNSQSTYISKFRRDRLNYFMSFSEGGELLNIGFKVKEVDIPSDSYSNIEAYLSANFDKVKVRRMYQEYPVPDITAHQKTIEDAFQNLLLPANKYKLIMITKKEGKRVEYEAYFSAEGNFVKIRQSLPANYDHVLY